MPLWSVTHGHNLTLLARVSPGQIALAYLDPPFCTGSVFKMPDGEVAFDDRWPSFDAYMSRLRETCIEVRDLLAGHGTLVLHVDTRVSHYAKVMLDGVFGRECFASEIVWRYRRWPTRTRNFQRVHDVLLRYVRDPAGEPRWNQLYEPLSAKTVATWGTSKQRAVWVKGEDRAEKQTSRRARSSRTNERSPGVPMGDVWDIGIVAPVSRERTGFPTQKPVALLERLILATTNPGDLVLDPYCGSGTSGVVCARTGRRWVGYDSSDAAVRITRERLKAVQLTLRAAGGT